MGGALARPTANTSDLTATFSELEQHNEEGFTQLMVAARDENITDISVLLHKGADLETNDPVFGTALTVAAIEGKARAVEVLVEHKANLEFPTKDLGYTPLLAACQRGHACVIELSLTLRANPNAVTKNGLTCAMLLAASDPPVSDTLSLLLKHHININAVNQDGMTALMIAAKNGHVSPVKSLVGAKADVRVKDKQGMCAIQLSSSPAITEILYCAKAQSRRRQEGVHAVYELHEVLGEGTFGKVKKCLRKIDRKHFAVKIIKTSNLNVSEKSAIDNEFRIMRLIRHENCVKLVDCIETAKKRYMVMELCMGDYHEKLIREGFICEEEAKRVIEGIAKALEHLHSLGIAHRDLKPENVMMGENDLAKLADFGLAKHHLGDLMRTTCGTPFYAAPEVLKADGYGPAADMWSLGVMLYMLLSGFPPFHHTNVSTLYALIKKGEFTFAASQWEKISEAAKDLIRSLLVLDSSQRATPTQVLEHQWLNSGVVVHLRT